MKITSFEDLDCWQEARLLVRKIYDVTRAGDFKKDLRLSGQVQAAATSCMANIAEGFERRIAMASSAEVKSHLYVALDQGYINQNQFKGIYEQAQKTAQLVSAFIKYLRKS